MKAEVQPGKYIVAVSGGVDSVALLNLLAENKSLELVVAHFNHGIRSGGAADEELVRLAAAKLNLPIEVGYGRLGPKTSEETARAARYEFLNAVWASHDADSIITAHHQDDLIETALINLLRGTGRRGLVAISNNKSVRRPLLAYPKSKILSYAKKNQLQWLEDPTNTSQDYLRNYVRFNLVAKMTASQRRQFLGSQDQISRSSAQIDGELSKLSPKIFNNQLIDRSKFSVLPVELGNELLTHWLRQEGLLDFDKRTINRINVAIRTGRNQSVHAVKDNLNVKVTQKTARFEHSPRQ